MSDSGRLVNRYNPIYVREGHWVDEYCRNKHEVARYWTQKTRRELLLQAPISRLFELLLAPVITREYSAIAAIGDVLQVKGSDEVLSVVVPDETYLRTQLVPEGAPVCSSRVTRPCVRNTWVLWHPEKQNGEILNYGDTFYLMLNSPREKSLPMFLRMGSPFGTLTDRPGHSPGELSTRPDRYCRLYVRDCADPDHMEGYPVRSLTDLFIMSAATNTRLVVDKMVEHKTFLGKEHPATFFYTAHRTFNPPSFVHIWTLV